MSAALSDVPGATALYELLRPYSGRNAVSAPDVCIGSVDRSLGVLAAACGEWDVAAGHFAEAERMNERTGGRPWLAQTRLDHARSVLASGRGEPEQASALAAAARKAADELGMTALGDAARALSAASRAG